MSADLPSILSTWDALRPLMREEKCAACECLQGALVELKLALEELPEGAEQTQLLSGIAQAMRAAPPHPCLGCEPCNPGNILADFYRRQSAPAPAAQPCCDAG
jgi:hypothetical protein